VRAIEDAFGTHATTRWLPEQPGDVPQTWASVDKARRLLGYTPKVSLHAGLQEFARWFERAPGAPQASRRAAAAAA